MTQDSTLFAFADPTQVCLEVSQTSQDRAWEQSQRFSTPSCRWNAYLNQICQGTFQDWLREEYATATIWPNSAALPSFWEVVNGSAIALDITRLVLVPSVAIDLSELRVPQEWIDIPSWAGDYYLAAQVEPDEGWVRIWGFATHQQLKTKGSYDASDRTYSLDSDDLIKDINVLWVARELCPNEPTRATVAPLPALPLAQAENLISRLGSSDIVTPRLAVPIDLWGALLEHGGWRQRLYQRRLGLPEQWSILQWLSSGVSSVAQQLGWGRVEFQPSWAGAKGTQQTQAPLSVLSRKIAITGQPYELQVIPQGDPESRIWRFELRHLSSGGIPRGLKLRLLTEDLLPFENNEAVATTTVDRLYVKVALEPGEGLVWEIDPVPENYDREILRF